MQSRLERGDVVHFQMNHAGYKTDDWVAEVCDECWRFLRLLKDVPREADMMGKPSWRVFKEWIEKEAEKQGHTAEVSRGCSHTFFIR
jgi:hypothetical protein